MKTLMDHISTLTKARAEAEALFRTVDLAVIDLDEAGLVLPGKIDLNALTLTWMIGPQKALEDGGVVSFDLGVKLWLPGEDSGPVASVFITAHGPEREVSWREVKRLCAENGWRVMVGVNGWKENQVEAARIARSIDLDPKEIAQAVFEAAKALGLKAVPVE